uniref:Rep protein n=2 Tax=Natrinema thermotolerans TaxID=121872 RepID=A3QQZ1_9EURY|nr:rep protein [Natrinema thermotolerans]
MTKRDGERLREEVVFDGIGGVRPLPWGEAIDRFDAWYREGRDTAVVCENSRGETTAFRTPNRFTPEYREMLYAKSQSLERELREKWGRLLHTAMVTLTASSTDEQGRPRSPVDHLHDLLESWEAVRRALARVLDGRDWEYLAIIEPHESGYAHVHVGVFVKGPVVAEQFQPVLDAHVRNCPTATSDAHQVFDEDGEEDAVSVHRTASRPGDEGVENLGAYLAAYMAGEYGAEATEMPEYVRGFYATMWATGRQWFRPSNGAQEFMQPDEDEDDEDEEQLAEDWELVGIAPDGDPEEELIEIDPEEARRDVYRNVRFEDWPGPGDRQGEAL